MSGTEIVTVGRALPKLAAVAAAEEPYGVCVTWADGPRAGRSDRVDLAPILLTFKVFRVLREDPALFRTVRLGDWGASIVWDGNADLEIGAEAIEDLVAQTMTNDDFSAFLKRNGLSFDAAAAQLGVSRRLIAYYTAERAIPRHIALACRYLDATLNPATAGAWPRVA